MVNFVLSEGLEFRDYVVAYTNASVIVDESFVDAEDLDGMFSGWDEARGRYDQRSWAYAAHPAADTASTAADGGHARERGGGSATTTPDGPSAT